MSPYKVYILTNQNKTVLYIGVTNDLVRRLKQHRFDGNQKSFTHRYQCFYLLYFERYDEITEAIQREKQLKKWSRSKKLALIKSSNPELHFLEY